MTETATPAAVWTEMQRGNARFVAGEPSHPRQDVERRHDLAHTQAPRAALFGCADSRLAAEIIFDQGLGDLFVVRTAGHVLDTTVIGSIEYGVEVLGAPLVVVLGHDSCGAVAAATAALNDGVVQRGFVRAVVDRVIPSIIGLGEADGPTDAATLGHEHVRNTVQMLQAYSVSLAEAIDAGRCAIVGLEYTLADGTVHLVETAGEI